MATQEKKVHHPRSSSGPRSSPPKTLSISYHSLTEKKGRQCFSDAASELLQGQKIGLEITDIIARKQTLYKDMLLLNSTAFGKVLVFDGNTQITEKDGFVYYEMCSHVAMCSHPEAKDILIVGGLDGSWLAQEILKYACVQRIVHLEQDTEMLQFLQANFHAPNFDPHNNPKFQFFNEDPKEYLKHCHEEFDIIITDCTAPPRWGIWVELMPPTDVLKGNMRWVRNLFPSVSYFIVGMPSVASGQAGYIICSKATGVDFSKPVHILDDDTIAKWGLRYYNPEVHRAAFALPQFAKVALSPNADSPVIARETRKGGDR